MALACGWQRGGFAWADQAHGAQATLSAEQLQALLIGLPWQGLGPGTVITML